MIDTHSHIYDEAYDEDFNDVLQRAKDAGVGKMVMPGIDSKCHDRMMECARKLEGYAYPAIGLHPTSVDQSWRDELQFVWDNYRPGDFVAIGEIGLDEYWSKDFLEEQKRVFEDQLTFAWERDLPVIIHARNATEDIFDCLDRVGKTLRGVFHAFSGSYETYCRIKKSYGGFKIGVGGVVTYKNSHLAAFMDKVPLEDILLETDAPWLTPVPFRGKRNESAYIRYTAQKLAELKGLSIEETDAVTTDNAIKIFGL
ncbi:MAG: TatD family hydrolase [Bacteroidales bacterium]|nr:TatD family hydrolase [Bacteroidales bacterium]